MMTSFKGFFYALSLFVMSGVAQPLLSSTNDIPGTITATLAEFFPIPFTDDGDCYFKIIIDGPNNRRTVSEPIHYTYDSPTASSKGSKLNQCLGKFLPTQKGNYGDYFVYLQFLDVETPSCFMPLIVITDSREKANNFVLMPPVVTPMPRDNNLTDDKPYLFYLGTFSVR